MPLETVLFLVIPGQPQSRRADELIASLAGRQHGVVSCAQVLELGLGRGAIDDRLARRALHRVHRGVYAVGHPTLTAHGRRMAAVLAGGDGAVLSHAAAASLWELPGESSAVQVTTPRDLRPRPGITFHRSSIPEDEVTSVDGIPVTTVARTLLDLAAVWPRYRVEKAINEAEYRRLSDIVGLAELIERYPRRRGLAALRAIIAEARLGESITRSELEDRFLDFVRRRGLPRPAVNVPLQIAEMTIEADCLWRERRVIVELDGRDAHERSAAFDSDRRRDRRLLALGWQPVRVTWRHLHAETATLEADLRTLLRAAARPGELSARGRRPRRANRRTR